MGAPLTPKLRLPLKLSHGSAMVVSMADTVWDTAMARGQLTLRPMPGTDMVASTAMDSQPMADMAMAVTAMARGQLMLMPGMDMVASTATDSQPTAVTAMARGLLRPSLRLMPGTDMVASTATDSQPMADMAMVVTAMARGLLMLRPSLRLMPGTDMVASTATDSQPMAV